MNKLVFFLGGAGAGKTTLAKALAARRKAAFFDMDILLRPAAEAIMTLHGLDPADRDSADYKRLCRDLGYRITMDAALDNVKLDVDSIVVGPFTKEAEDEGWIARELSRIGRSLLDVEVKVVIVSLSDETLYKERITARSSKLDDWKLRNWDDFRSSLVSRTVKWPLPPSSILYFDNSGNDPARAADTIERFVYPDA
ncbi:AAA domain-containing protein [Paenibacillus sophorae]|uniref:AAA domain-containing protein n=1 Tax=Paenibacillus sophorae TaxID=1333845 RepID=A0A1H8JP35_9BACL|nr:AAA family ATPase [Paenibacillus sophorae]QWU13431.1 AAA family ATPase [Paenibacillus sophorae]SEN82321.1 AAA domain-containing protein [Paenibacillus sophorae]